MENKYELIFTILNRGFSDLVMDSARQSGATGGTIITARGAGAKEVQRLFGITISQEKEIILILTLRENKNAIMSAICKSAGLNTQGKGITFSLPVDDVYGVSLGITNLSKGTQEVSDSDKQQPNQSTGENVNQASETEQTNAVADVTLPTGQGENK